MPFLFIFGSVFLVSLVSLVGVVVLLLSTKKIHDLVFFLVALSVGALYGDVFFHLLPDLFAKQSGTVVGIGILLGILFFFVLEKFLHWHHHSDEADFPHTKAVGYLNLIADGVHNLLDGAFIATAYFVSVPVGVATTVAVLLHEIPQEIGDLGVLISSGFKPKEALFWNLMSALASFLGALIVFFIGAKAAYFSQLLLPFTAGSFLYIAGSDLVPELHRTRDVKKSTIQFFAIVFGILLMASLLFFEL
jgi:zinc and cadmium transporter